MARENQEKQLSVPSGTPRVSRPILRTIAGNLTFWVLIAVLAGVLLGHLDPGAGVAMKVVGETFIALIKVFIGPVVFLTIVLGIAGMNDLRRVGRIGLKALVYFEIVTTFALLIGVGVAFLLQPGRIDRGGLAMADGAAYASAGFSWWAFLSSNFTLKVLIAALCFGVMLHYLRGRDVIVAKLQDATSLVFRLLRVVMYLAPLGAFGGMAYTVGKFGLDKLVPLGKLVGSVYLTMLIFIFGVLGVIMRIYGLRIWTLLRALRDELLLVLGTSSSEAALPSLMQKLGRMGCSKPIVGLVVPTGYSFNLDGTSIYLSMAVIFLAQLYGVDLTAGEVFSIIGLLMVTSKGAAGVTGSGFIVLASTLTALHRIPVEGLAFLLGVDKFMSEARALTNLVGNSVATLVIARMEGDPVDVAGAIRPSEALLRQE